MLTFEWLQHRSHTFSEYARFYCGDTRGSLLRQMHGLENHEVLSHFASLAFEKAFPAIQAWCVLQVSLSTCRLEPLRISKRLDFG